MTNSNNFNQNILLNGLVTFSITVPVTDMIFVRGSISLPQISRGSDPSAVVAVVKKNGSAVYTGTAGATGFQTEVSCASGDVIAIQLSSAATVDQGLNVIKTTIALGQGI